MHTHCPKFPVGTATRPHTHARKRFSPGVRALAIDLLSALLIAFVLLTMSIPKWHTVLQHSGAGTSTAATAQSKQ